MQKRLFKQSLFCMEGLDIKEKWVISGEKFSEIVTVNINWKELSIYLEMMDHHMCAQSEKKWTMFMKSWFIKNNENKIIFILWNWKIWCVKRIFKKDWFKSSKNIFNLSNRIKFFSLGQGLRCEINFLGSGLYLTNKKEIVKITIS